MKIIYDKSINDLGSKFTLPQLGKFYLDVNIKGLEDDVVFCGTLIAKLFQLKLSGGKDFIFVLLIFTLLN